jgi:hypothetical protein
MTVARTNPVRPAMIDPASVAFDVDGVIADTMALFLEIAAYEFDVRGIRYEDITCYNLVECIGMDPVVIDRILSRILEGRYTRPLKAIPGAAAVLRRVARRAEPLLLVRPRGRLGARTSRRRCHRRPDRGNRLVRGQDRGAARPGDHPFRRGPA